jgi:hypothetical protein
MAGMTTTTRRRREAGPARQSRRVRPSVLVLTELIVLVALVAGCGSPGGSGATGSTGPARSGSAIPADLPLLGTWTVEVTKGDLEAGGVADPGTRNENSGRFTWTFNPDGTWTEVQESLDGSPIINPVFRGEFRVSGSTLTATTTFPEQYRDDGLEYAWTVDGDDLRLDILNPPDPVLPLVVETHPWKRAG